MKKILFALLIGSAVVGGCNKDSDFNPFFSIEDDKELGKQVSEEIASDPTTYPVLDSSQYPEAYAHLNRITNNILNSGNVKYKDEFAWKLHLIHDDEVLNAFATPGGYIYVYTGLIKFLDNEHELAGVMGHEIAHADRRHSTDQLTKAYGVQTLIDVVLGKNEGLVKDIAQNLLLLKFGRSAESEADEYSVIYLCPTEYMANGAAAFFEKLGTSNSPEFLSTHPNPETRVEDINAKYEELACEGTGKFDQRYQEFKNSLPQ
jgi:predicted Zn-dependent protease